MQITQEQIALAIGLLVLEKLALERELEELRKKDEG